MNVRCLKFKKRFANVSQREEIPQWIVLGHLDEMECTNLQEMTLEKIHKSNDDKFKEDSESLYHHIIYLIDDGQYIEGETDDATLWKTNNEFISVTRIHFPYTTNFLEQYDQLKESFFALAKQDCHTGISWRSYYTMELSDMVLVSKANSFRTLINWSLTVTNSSLVGKAYTYFCIPGALLKPENKEYLIQLSDDSIDFMSIRFDIRGDKVDNTPQEIRGILGEEYTDPPFRVTGNEDVIICGRNVPTTNLIKLCGCWYQDKSDRVIHGNIITRIGTECEPQLSVSGANATGNKNLLEDYSVSLLNQVRDYIQSEHRGSSPSYEKEWMRPLITLTNALVHMSKSATLDEQTFLILPSLYAFWKNVMGGEYDEQDESLYLRFAELCVHTMEHLMRGEGQLSQRQEMRPLSYDIPVFVLEYATAFLFTISKKMTHPDGKNAAEINFLLVPSAENDVSTAELFRAKAGMPGLLLITVPFSMLYQPKYLLPSLCHELAHYVGECLRMRQKRYDCFIRCAALALMIYLCEKESCIAPGFFFFLKEQFLDANIREGAKEFFHYEGDITNLPLADLENIISCMVSELESTDGYAELMRNYLFSTYQPARLKNISEQVRFVQLHEFVNRLHDIVTLFREIYADICMQFFLNLSLDTYLEVVLRQWRDNLNTNTLLRIYITLSTVGYGFHEIWENIDHQVHTVSTDNGNDVSIYEALRDIHTLTRSNDKPEYYVTQYIIACWRNLNAHCAQVDTQAGISGLTPQQIYEKMLLLDERTIYPDILQIIDEGRKIILEQF